MSVRITACLLQFSYSKPSSGRLEIKKQNNPEKKNKTSRKEAANRIKMSTHNMATPKNGILSQMKVDGKRRTIHVPLTE